MRIRQRPQQRGVGDAEDRRRRADAERERADGGQSERRRSRERAERIADVLPEHVEPAKPALFPHLLLHLIESAKIPAGRKAGVVGRQPVPPVFGSELIQMRFDFL